MDKWLFVLKNMARLDKLPTFLKKPVFQKLFQIAEYSNLNKGEKQMYDVSLKRKWDEYAVREYWETEGMQKGIEKGIEKGMQKGIEKGIEKGMQKGIQETQRKNALNMLSLGLSLEIISKSVDLPIDEIKKLCSL
ncbi:hypothetical protein A1D19_01550 [Lonepinella koalarum]|nr:hypothetical protein [Lonepinella koalarum]